MAKTPFSLMPQMGGEVEEAGFPGLISRMKQQDMMQQPAMPEAPAPTYGLPEKVKVENPAEDKMKGDIASAGITGAAALAKAMMDARAIREKQRRESAQDAATQVAKSQQEAAAQQLGATYRPLQSLIASYRSVI